MANIAGGAVTATGLESLKELITAFVLGEDVPAPGASLSDGPEYFSKYPDLTLNSDYKDVIYRRKPFFFEKACILFFRNALAEKNFKEAVLIEGLTEYLAEIIVPIVTDPTKLNPTADGLNDDGKKAIVEALDAFWNGLWIPSTPGDPTTEEQMGFQIGLSLNNKNWYQKVRDRADQCFPVLFRNPLTKINFLKQLKECFIEEFATPIDPNTNDAIMDWALA